MNRKRIKDFAFVSGKRYDGIMGRCYRESESGFSRYGGRGIRVCSAWIKDINAFRTWLLTALAAAGINEAEFLSDPGRYQVDRIDNDGPYAPLNCRISTPQANNRNRGLCRTVISAEGEEIQVGSLSTFTHHDTVA